jgi:hypothetical protein
LAQATTFVVVGPFLTLASALAPAHVHRPGPGHEHAVTHSHLSPHHLETHDHRADAAPEIEHDDEAVVWIDSPILHEVIGANNPVLPVTNVESGTVFIECHWSVTPFDDAAPVHGPPKLLPLFRGPPCLPV